MKNRAGRRVVVTGMGALTSMGTSVEEMWRALLEGKSGIGYIRQFDSSRFPIHIGGEIDLTKLPPLGQDTAAILPSDRASYFAALAADEAWRSAQAGSSAIDRERAGVCIGASTFPVIEDRLHRLRDLLRPDGWNTPGYLEFCRDSPAVLRQSDASTVSRMLSRRFQLQGASLTVQAACTSACHAIGNATRLIRNGEADVMLTGGTDSMLSMMCVTGFTLLGGLSSRWESPERASRPFDRTRDGFVLSEGAAILVLEELEHALRRGAAIYAEIGGFGSSCDAYRFTDVHPEGLGAVMCLRSALGDAGLRPEDIGYINAHGTSTRLNDSTETAAIRQVFGRYADRVPVSSNKSQLGHLLCAAGAIELICTIRALREGVLPATINLDHPDPECDLDYIPWKPRPAEVRYAVSNSFGFGGQNGSLVVAAYDANAGAQFIPGPRRDKRMPVVTGVGIVSPLALGARTHFEHLTSGVSGVRRTEAAGLRELPLPFEARVGGFERRDLISHRMLRKILTRAAAFAVIAAGEAIEDAGVPTGSTLENAALCVGSLGLDQDFDVFTDALRTSLDGQGNFSSELFVRRGMHMLDPLFLVRSLPNSGLCGTAIQHGIRGPNINVMTGSASGLHAVRAGAAGIRDGEVELALCGGYDSLLQLEVVIGHLISQRTCRTDLAFSPEQACRPFDNARNGYPPGEGAAFLVLEEESRARARGARIYAHITGDGQCTANEPDLDTCARALEAAARAATTDHRPDALFADGLALPFHDAMEARVAQRLGGQIPVTAATGAVGHCGVAGGMFSLVHAVLSLETGILPPALNCDVLAEDCAGANIVRRRMEQSIRRALVWTSDRGLDNVAMQLERRNGSH